MIPNFNFYNKYNIIIKNIGVIAARHNQLFFCAMQKNILTSNHSFL